MDFAETKRKSNLSGRILVAAVLTTICIFMLRQTPTSSTSNFGFLDNQNARTSIDDLEEYSDFERPVRSARSRRDSGGRKFRPSNRERDDDWKLPMDYL